MKDLLSMRQASKDPQTRVKHKDAIFDWQRWGDADAYHQWVGELETQYGKTRI